MVIQKYILLSSFENIYKKWDVTKKYKMYETVSLYTTLKIITFLRNNYFLCKHNLALRQREKVMQVKQWSSYSTADHLTVPWQSFSLDTQAFDKNRVQFTSRLAKPDDSIQQNGHSRELASQQSDAELFHPVRVGQADLAETEGSHYLSLGKFIHRRSLTIFFTTAA